MACSKSPAEFSLQDLQNCTNTYKTDEEILEYLVTQSQRVEVTINRTDLSADLCYQILRLLSKGLKCESKTSLVVELLNIVRDSQLLLVCINNVLHKCEEQFEGNNLLQLLWYIIDILNEILKRMPSSIAQYLGLILVIKKVVENQRTPDAILEFDEILSKTNFLRNSAFLELSKPHSNKTSLKNHIERKPPPNNFREIPIFPSKEDIFPTSDVYLRPIIAKGSYKDLDHYLDVQFRLYREDCISQLRDGIAEYVTQISGGQDVHRLQDVRLYKNVYIINKEVSLDGTLYRVQLDPHYSKRIKWESSKHLMYGSLVCLTPNNFRTLLFAIVVESDRDVLQSTGTFKVQFSNEVIPFTVPYTNLTMVETTAFFEAYRHVLSSLQNIQSGDLPFERYIVHCRRDILPPSYLDNDNVSYDLFPVQAKTHISLTVETDHNLHRRDRMRSALTIKHDNQARVKNVKILTNDWPPADDLHFDQSQFEAFRSALTKEFVLIQGPPGTGKTHVGLQIAKTLLHNRQRWKSGEDQIQPMLIVCFTNHALDQFMEGIVGLVSHTTGLEKWKNQIVRVGGRCNNETIKELSLKNKRSRFSPSKTLYKTSNDLQDSIALLKWRLKKSEEVIFDEILKESVVEKEFQYLFEPVPNSERGDEKGNHCLPVLFKWLGVTQSCWISRSQKMYKNQQRKNKSNRNISMEMNNPSKTKLLYQQTGPEEHETTQNIAEENIEVESEADRVKDDRQIEKEVLLVRTKFVEKLGLDVNMQLDHILKNDDLPRDKAFIEILSNQASETLIELQKPDTMTESEFQHLQRTNIWKMSYVKRWKLYRYWLHKYRENTKTILSDKEELFKKTVEDYKSEKDLEDERILRRSTVIAMTTTGAARYQDILRKVGPKIILVEEAAEVLEAHVIAALSSKCEHLILIGDHKQLEPKPAVFELAKKYNLSLSMFERMLKNGLSFHCLQRQHRMRPEISKIIRHIYPSLEDNENVLSYDNVGGVKRNVYFLDHCNEESYDDNGKSYSNLYEAEFIVQLCRYLIKQGYEKSQITVLAAYSGQMFRLRNLMPKAKFEGVRLTVVDNYQGEENDIIILSLVRNNTKGKIGFLKRENRICVALSRAKKGLYIIGNLTMLSKASELWKKVLIDLGEIGAVGKSLPLYCQNHPKEAGIMAKEPFDFRKAPDGGCLFKCDFRLPCGHACRLKCHPVDRDHTKYKCKKPCLRECENVHKCQKRCHYPGNCNCPIEIEKDLLCNHKAIMKCCEDPVQYKCEITVKKSLKCGHSALMFCFKNPDTHNCLEEITVTLPRCKHEVIMLCGESHLKKFSYQCKKVVEHTFPCGHIKDVMCFEAPYSSCKQLCNKQCDNGHTCKQTCHYRTECQCRIKIEKSISKCGHIQKMRCNQTPDSFDCLMVVTKEVPTCGHMQDMPCYSNPKLHRCTELVEKIGSCKHLVKVECSASQYRISSYCEELVTKKLLYCSHTQLFPCNKSPRNEKCNEMVEIKNPICGHYAHVPCNENPERHPRYSSIGCLNTRRKFQYPECKTILQLKCERGHSREVPCNKQHTSFCQETCEEVLECDHKCDGICGQCEKRNAHNKCETEVTKRCPNGHETKMPCAAIKHYTCNFSCNQILICGHKCPGTCFQCHRGTFHIPCKYFCHRKQFCGHACRSPCGRCEPCKKPCRQYCSHGPCKLRCSEPCLPCQKTCSWSCIHLKCTRLCHEICNRGACNKPCSKKLSCGHKCLGFCGEPCPNLCRMCDRREFEQVQKHKVGYSRNNIVFLVFLPDCGHIFQATYIDSYIENGRETLSEISSKEINCPLCKTPIEWHPRYGNIIKKQKNIIQSIKHELKDSINAFPRTEINTIVSYVQKFESFCDCYYYCTDISELEKCLSYILSEAKALLCSIQLLQKNRKLTQQQIKDLNSCMVTIAIQWLVLFYLTTHKDIPYGSNIDTDDSEMEDESNISSDVLQKFVDASDGLMQVEDGRLELPNSLTSKNLEVVKGLSSLQKCSDQIGFVNAGNPPLMQEPKINFHQCDWMACKKGHAWPVATNSHNCQKCEEQKLEFQETTYEEFDGDVVRSEDHQREIVNEDDGTSMKKKHNKKIKVQQSKPLNKKDGNTKRIQIDSKHHTNFTVQKDGKANEHENETMADNSTRMPSFNRRRGVGQRGKDWSSKRHQNIGNNETMSLQLSSSVKDNWRGSHVSVGENNIERSDKTWREGGSNRRGRGQQSNVLIFENSKNAVPKPQREERGSNRPGRGSGYISVEEKSDCRQGDREQENVDEKRQCRNSMNRTQKGRNTKTSQSWRKGGRGRGGNTRY